MTTAEDGENNDYTGDFTKSVTLVINKGHPQHDMSIADYTFRWNRNKAAIFRQQINQKYNSGGATIGLPDGTIMCGCLPSLRK